MKHRKFLRPFFGLSATIIAFAVLTGCHGGAEQKKAPAPTVTVAPVEARELVEWDEFTGRIEPVESVEVRPRVSGYIQEIKFQSGQLVKKGDILLIIDPRWHQAEFNRRQAETDQAKVRLDNARAALLASEAARDSAKLDLEYTEVRSPINGRVSRALFTEGNYVSGLAGGATLLTTIVSVDPVYVYADIDENSLLRFNELAHAKKLETNGEGKIPIQLQLADEPEFPHTGYIESFDNRLNPDTGSILLRAVFPNPDSRIVPGLFARIRVPLSERHPALLVEERAIGTDQAQKFVLRLTSTNTVEYRPVTLGPLLGGKRIVRTGLEGDERIVVNGLARVRPGMPVAPQDAIAAKEDPKQDPKLARR
jgi:RND family efflux transporter MFP subunit